MTTYKQLNIPCHGYHIDEDKQADQLMKILVEHRPDMLVLTGHDGLVKGAKDYKDINSYPNPTTGIYTGFYLDFPLKWEHSKFLAVEKSGVGT
ncbi:hypothetical protein DCCM_2355 [Desulfocucumis palustris]|uniref:Uncharacterized protein n=2 Tax=Desulfocucumis palustris TaxID=1898651 RepID=A0A2L2XGA3_9FIRM|nr:hypothetical protein DCCM_2355 [Desulfocucumis palustris]